ncbi:molecular chaperone SurA [Spiribacter sp. 2438]|uniref:peptidylprolyl isomerase n=1 Tax=Spiribacter sp. 2438 TaxID=2666185 RepID=UPI0012B13EBF|nr:peptidylprolyl isomerase [Spiribacter sp. 2438]QGM22213.1 molecular chaperone SurA [Spiribacter sp. 2438]
MFRAFLAALIFLLTLGTAKADEVLLDRIVALVNEDVILASELQAEMDSVRMEMRQRGMSMPPEEELQRQVLERLVMQTLQINVAERRGIRVDSATLDRAVRQIADNNNLSLAGLRDALEEQGLDMAQFRDQLRREIIIDRLHSSEMQRRIEITSQEIEQFLARNRGQSREYRLSQILIGIPEAASAQAIEAAREEAESVIQRLEQGESFEQLATVVSDARNALEGGEIGWRTSSALPPGAADAIRALSVGEYTAPLRTPAGFQIYRVDEIRDPDAQLVEQLRIRHILIEPNEVVSDEDARLRLTSLRNRLRDGAEFAALARSNSDDASSASGGGQLGWVTVSQLPDSFRDAVQGLPEGAISEPFRTGAGWHIAEVQDRRERDVSEEVAREEATRAIRSQKAEEEIELWLRELREEAYVESRLDRL